MESTFKYVGFWKRFWASLLDGLLMFPVTGLLFWLGSSNKFVAIVTALLSMAFVVFYEVYLLQKYGGTPGKLFCGIKVIKADGSKLDLKSSFMRYSVDMVLLIISSLVGLYGIFLLTDEQLALGVWEKATLLSKITPYESYTGNVLNVWFVVDGLVLLFNSKKQAIHDFIAKTVVVYNDNSN